MQKKLISILMIFFLALSLCFAESKATEVNLMSGSYAFLSESFLGDSFVGNFRQVKAVAGTTRTFQSTGRIQLSAEKGIVWYTEKPYASILVVGENSLIQKIRNNAPTHLDLAENQIYSQIAKTLQCVFTGSFDTMSNLFYTYLEGDANGWTLRLVPKKNSLSSFIESIVMTGSQKIESLTLYEVIGDSIRYEFSDLICRKLTDEELQVYEM